MRQPYQYDSRFPDSIQIGVGSGNRVSDGRGNLPFTLIQRRLQLVCLSRNNRTPRYQVLHNLLKNRRQIPLIQVQQKTSIPQCLAKQLHVYLSNN